MRIALFSELERGAANSGWSERPPFKHQKVFSGQESNCSTRWKPVSFEFGGHLLFRQTILLRWSPATRSFIRYSNRQSACILECVVDFLHEGDTAINLFVHTGQEHQVA